MSFPYGESTILKVDSTAVGDVLTISDAGTERDWIDQTTLDCTAEAGRPSRIEKGTEFSVECLYDPTGHATLLGKADDATASTIAIEFWGDGTAALKTWSASGFMMGFSFSGMEVNGTPKVTYKFRWAGPPSST